MKFITDETSMSALGIINGILDLAGIPRIAVQVENDEDESFLAFVPYTAEYTPYNSI